MLLPAVLWMALAVFAGGGYSAVGGAGFGVRRRRLLRLREQILADLVALDLVVGGRRRFRR